MDEQANSPTFSELQSRAHSLAGSCAKQILIGGEWTPGRASEPPVVVDDPATGEPFAEVASATSEDATAALTAAHDAFAEWSRTAPHDRAQILRRAYDLLMHRREEVAALLTLEMGKPYRESLGEIQYAADYLAWFSEEALRIDGRYSVSPDGRGRVLVMKQPVGPCFFIVPWNFPLVMSTRGLAPAIAVGCTMIVKPSRLAPLTPLVLAEVLMEAGLPEGVLSVLPTRSSGAVTDPLLCDPRLRKLTFTGSTDVGRKLIAQSADQVLRLSLELGGNAPFIVFDDADIEEAVSAALGAKLRNNGEACTSANRFYIHRAVFNDFAELFADRMSEVHVGHGLDPDSQLGPLIEEAQRSRIQGLVDDAVHANAKVLTGGSRVDGNGYFYPPTVLRDVPESSRLATTEIFGPVAPLIPFDTAADVVRMANATDYGLAAYVFTGDFERALSTIEALETGMVALNQGRVSNPQAPFGGVKHSGLGRAGGPEAIAEYLETKYVAIRHSSDLS